MHLDPELFPRVCAALFASGVCVPCCLLSPCAGPVSPHSCASPGWLANVHVQYLSTLGFLSSVDTIRRMSDLLDLSSVARQAQMQDDDDDDDDEIPKPPLDPEMDEAGIGEEKETATSTHQSQSMDLVRREGNFSTTSRRRKAARSLFPSYLPQASHSKGGFFSGRCNNHFPRSSFVSFLDTSSV